MSPVYHRIYGCDCFHGSVFWPWCV